ncbi:uncharacterized protein LOC118095083 isoform X2 [Zootoca vivipara]|uniref:uncharacterized protein LOC118095083 isoform X2 n=1 Tax=Zootoca vivipara TaxID=8524 RepID=UPI00293BDA08|nr:uncharacterized protein LOC118095083 isoform X2 [Zootoca vivipara]
MQIFFCRNLEDRKRILRCPLLQRNCAWVFELLAKRAVKLSYLPVEKEPEVYPGWMMALTSPQLTDGNYSLWSFRMRGLLECKDLFNYATDTPPQPLTPEWIRGDNKAKAFINMAVSNQQVVYIRDKTSAKEMWESLAAVHLRKESASALAFYRQLYQAKLQPGGDLAAHLRHLQEIRLELLRRDVVVPDNQFCFIILCSLNKEYDAVASQLALVPPDQLSIEGVTAKLMAELDRRDASVMPVPKEENVNSNDNRDVVALRANKKCFACGLWGHFASECRAKSKKTSSR